MLASIQMTIGDITLDVPPAVQARMHQVRVQLEEVAGTAPSLLERIRPGSSVLGLTETIASSRGRSPAAPGSSWRSRGTSTSRARRQSARSCTGSHRKR